MFAGLILCLALNLTPQSGPQSQNSVPPLSDPEKRTVLQLLYELKSTREQIAAYEAYLKREAELDAKERQVWQDTLNNERARVELEKQKTTLAEEKAALYKALYESVTKKRGAGCIFKKIITLGIARCR